jgi:hypothetical protein
LPKKSVENNHGKFTHGHRHNMDTNREKDTTARDRDANR